MLRLTKKQFELKGQILCLKRPGKHHRRGEVDLQEGQGERHPAGQMPGGPQPPGSHLDSGGGAEADQELPV